VANPVKLLSLNLRGSPGCHSLVVVIGELWLGSWAGRLWVGRCGCAVVGGQWWVPGWEVLARQLWVGSFRGAVMACQL